MATETSSSAAYRASKEELRMDLLKQGPYVKNNEERVWLHEQPPAIPYMSNKVVYQRNGNIFFRKIIKSATTFEQKQLELAKAQLQKLSST